MEKTLEMLIEPRPKERPRVAMIGGHPRIYTPKKTEEYEEAIRKAWIKANGEDPFTGPLVLRVWLGMRIPKSTSKVNRVAMLERRIRPTVKPDVDNCAKSVLDALNGVAYKDDNQIVTLLAKKYYTETPCIKVVVAEWTKSRKGDEHGISEE